MKRLFLILFLIPATMISTLSSEKRTDKITPEIIREAQIVKSSGEAETFFKKHERLSEPQKLLLTGIIRLHLALAGGADDVKTAVVANRNALETTCQPLARGYYGSALILESRYLFEAGDMNNALAKIEEGIQQLDQAVAEDSSDLNLRELRMEFYWNLSRSSPIQRLDAIRADLDFLRSRYDSLESVSRSQAHLFEGLLQESEKRHDEALASYEKAVRADPKGPYAARARELLKKAGN